MDKVTCGITRLAVPELFSISYGNNSTQIKLPSFGLRRNALPPGSMLSEELYLLGLKDDFSALTLKLQARQSSLTETALVLMCKTRDGSATTQIFPK